MLGLLVTVQMKLSSLELSKRGDHRPVFKSLVTGAKPLWKEGRVEVLADPAAKLLKNPQAVSDGSGGAIIVAEVRKGGCVYTRYPLCGYIPRAGSSGRIEESGLTLDKQVLD